MKSQRVTRLGMKKNLISTLVLLLLITLTGCLDGGSFGDDPFADGSEAHPYPVRTVDDLKAVGSGADGWTLDKCYRQVADINMGGSGDWYPIGSVATPFTGTYDGRGYMIQNLTLAEVDYQSLFGAIQTGAELSDIHLKGVGGTGDYHMGWLVGHMLGGTVTDCSAEGSNSGYCKYGGGLICRVTTGVVSHCFTAGEINESIFDVGGLIWTNEGGTVSDCYSTATIHGVSNERSAGLVAVNNGTITRCYATGWVDYDAASGGLVCVNSGTVTDCYYDSTTTGQSDTGKGTPRTTAEMQAQSTYVGWDFTSVWRMSPGQYPRLRARTW